MIRFLILCVCTVALGWYVGSPYYVAYQMKQAADAQDSGALSSYVDFPALQANAKLRLDSAISPHIQTKDTVLTALGQKLGKLFSDKVVESTVTPEGLTKLLQGSQKVSTHTQVGSDRAVAVETSSSNNEVSLAYSSWDTFHIDVNNSKSKRTRLLLIRQGLSWKLVDVEFLQE